jgi:CHAD domain-containing protein
LAKALDIPGIEPDATFREAAASAIEVRADEVFAFRDRALDTSDIEGVHDMRVATRRLRAVMEIFAVCFPKEQHRRALKEVKDLADTLGERRDPDVMIDGLEKVAQSLGPADRSGIRQLERSLRDEQAEANERLAAMLDRIDRYRLRERLVALAAEARLG